jgi:TolB-like protein
MVKNISKSLIFASLSILLVTGCTYKEEVRTVKNGVQAAHQKVQLTKQHLEIARDKSENITNQNTLESTISSLAAQMMNNKKMNTTKPVIITSFVRLDSFKKTTEFGRVVSESLIDELSNRGFNIIEFRGQLAVSVNDEGEYFISRKTQKIKGKIPNTYVVVGTYSRLYEKIMLNARVIDNVTGKIITSARATYFHGKKNDCIMFNDCKPSRTIKIINEK